MKSYSVGRNLAGTWTKNSNSLNLTYLDQTANDAYRRLCALKDWNWLEQLRTLTTVGAQQFYAVPWDCARVKEISVIPLNSQITYVPKLSPSREHWDQLNLSKFTSDIPEWYFLFGGNSGAGQQIGLWPTPATTGNTINVTQKCRVVDLQIADVTNITSDNIANGSTTLTLSSSAATAGMAGMWVQIATGTAANLGDGQWYLITGVPTSSSLTLATAYGGTTLLTAAAAVTTISQMPLLPEDFHDLPWVRASQVYWEKEDDERSDKFKGRWDEGLGQLIDAWSSPGGDYVIDTGEDPELISPNLVIRL